MIILISAGAAAGIISGMGIGGGTVLIPILTIFLGISQHTAQGINLLYFIPTAVVALVIHFKNKNVDIKTALAFMLLGIAGAAAGSVLAGNINSLVLRKIFGVFLLFMGLYEFFKKDRAR